MKAVVAAFNQEKALVGAFSVITNLRMELFEALVDTMMHGPWARATPRQTPHPPRPHQVYGLQELLEAELLAVVLVQDSEHEVGRGHAVVEVGEQVGELLQRQAAGEVILKAVIIIIIIPVITMILILTWNPTYISSISSALCLVC